MHLIVEMTSPEARGESVRVFLVNAFSPSMLDLQANKTKIVSIRRITLGEFIEHVKAHKKTIQCAIGHQSTAKLVEELTGEKLLCERKQIQLQDGDIALVITLSFRPEEGKVYDLSELRRLYAAGKIVFYMVEVVG